MKKSKPPKKLEDIILESLDSPWDDITLLGIFPIEKTSSIEKYFVCYKWNTCIYNTVITLKKPRKNWKVDEINDLDIDLNTVFQVSRAVLANSNELEAIRVLYEQD